MRLNSICLERLDLAVKGLLADRYVGVAEDTQGWKCLLNRLVETTVYCVSFDDLVDTCMEQELAITFLTVRDIRARCRFVFKGLDE